MPPSQPRVWAGVNEASSDEPPRAANVEYCCSRCLSPQDGQPVSMTSVDAPHQLLKLVPTGLATILVDWHSYSDITAFKSQPHLPQINLVARAAAPRRGWRARERRCGGPRETDVVPSELPSSKIRHWPDPASKLMCAWARETLAFASCADSGKESSLRRIGSAQCVHDFLLAPQIDARAVERKCRAKTTRP